VTNKNWHAMSVAIAAAWFIVTGQISADDWLTYRHDPTRSGVSSESLDFSRLQQAWSWQSPHPPASAWSGPAKWDAYAGIRGLQSMRNYDPVFSVIATADAVYFGSSVDDTVRRLDLSNGKAEWAYTTGGPIRIAPTFADGKLYFGSDDGNAYCLAAESGELVWRVTPRETLASAPTETARQIINNQRAITLWPVRSGVAVLDNRAYFSASMLPWQPSYLCCVDAATGQRDVDGTFLETFNGQTMEGAIALSLERVVVPQGRVAPTLFDRGTGKGLGSLKGGGGCFVVVTPDGAVIHGPGNKTGWVTNSDSKSREVIATYKGGKVLCLDGDLSFLLTNDSLVATNFRSKKVLWKNRVQQFHTMIVTANAVICGGDGLVVAYDRTTGTKAWETAADGHVHDLAVSNGRLLASTDMGTITCFATGVVVKQEPVPMEDEALAQLPVSVVPLKTEGLLSQWHFHPGLVAGAELKPLVGKHAATFSGPPRFVQLDKVYALDLNGSETGLTVQERFQDAQLPAEKLTAEAWVRMDKVQSWGCIIGAMQDNGSHERGWLLGVTGNRFSFAVASERDPIHMTYLPAPKPFEAGRWYHVAGSYDGLHQKLYIDGELVAESDGQQGPIAYPTQAFYKIGVYHDADEHYPLNGMLHEVRVFRGSLPAETIKAHSKSRTLVSPQYAEMETGPYLQFDSPTTAVVRWSTATETVGKVLLRGESGSREFTEEFAATEHVIRIDGLRRQHVYEYRVVVTDREEQRQTAWLECDTLFNYTVQEASDQLRELGRMRVDQVTMAIEAVTGDGGLAVLLGADDGGLAAAIAVQSRMRVLVYDGDIAKVNKLRAELLDIGVYGYRIAVTHVENAAAVPLTSATANLVMATPATIADDTDGIVREMARVARPNGGVVVLSVGPQDETQTTELKRIASEVGLRVSETEGNMLIAIRPAFDGSGDWSHLYGSANNSAFNGETLHGVRSRDDLAVQWIGRPGARYQPDRSGRKPSPLSAGGRLYLQGLQRLIALDAYNGSILWSLEIPDLGRFNMPRDCGNWCADDNFLYVAIRDKCWQIEGTTGVVIRMLDVSFFEDLPADFDWGYLSSGPDLLIGSATKRGAAFKNFWGGANEGWYDAKSGDATGKVCSDTLFAYEKSSGKVKWQYSSGVLINSTISATKDRIYLVESRNKDIFEAETRRITDPKLWQDQYLVAIDRTTGKRIWEYSLATEPGTVVYYLAHSGDKLSLVASSGSKYHVYVFDADEGAANWEQHFAWPKDNHGGHMSRPAIVGNTLYVRPRAFDVRDGSVLAQSLPAGGCGTYAATNGALFFRSGNVTVWDREKGTTSSWPRLRPDCWLSTIPAGGMLLSPEGGGGCSCGSWLETSIGFIPLSRLAP